MSHLARIAVLAGETPASRAVAGAVASLLTAVGRWVDQVAADADLTGYALVVLPRAHGWRALRDRFAGPMLVVDADLLADRVEPAFARLLGGTPAPTLAVHAERVLLPRPLPPLAGPALGDVPSGLATEVSPGLAYALPLVLTPALRTVHGFWSLARVLEHAVAALLGESAALYAEPWPRGYRAARVLTYDLDGLEALDALPALPTDGRPGTLFCCADALDRLHGGERGLEVAAHGDVHRPFTDPRTDLERIDRMLAAFQSAGLAPRGFSPPSQTFTFSVGALLERFAYLRIEYQDRSFRFFPVERAGGVLQPISYYPDFMHRYVGAAEYARLLARFCAWAEATSALAVPCFHPCLWTDPLRRFLELPAGAAWETTLAEVTDWWTHRARSLAAVAAAGEGGAPPDVVLVRATPAARLAALEPVNGQPLVVDAPRAVRRVVVAGRPLRVVTAAESPASMVDVRLGAAWSALAWLPRGIRRGLVRVVNKNGLHACFYDDLGLAPEVVRGGLRLPVVAADEPIVLADRTSDLRQVARRMLGRLAGPVASDA